MCAINNENINFVLTSIDMTLFTSYLGFLFSFFSIFYQYAFDIIIFLLIKFLLAANLLILIRGGTPRYRYDYLTKLGWLKFLSLTLTIFFLFFLFMFWF